jgi:general secretion pathway protein G
LDAPRNDDHAFTLVELIIVIVIIGIIAAISTSSLIAARVRANEGAVQGALKGVQSAAISYRTVQGSYPVSLAAMGSSYLGGGLESGQANGYLFELRQGSAGESYTCTAVPRSSGLSGVRSFCTDVYSVIYIYNTSNIVADGITCSSGGTILSA